MTSVIERLAISRGRRDEVPNQELARELAESKDRAGIREVAENLGNKDKNIQADCVKRALVPYLLAHLRNCRPQDVPQHAEHTAVAVKAADRAEFVKDLEKRVVGMPASRSRRIARVIKSVA